MSDEPFLLVKSKRHKSKNSRICQNRNFLVEDDTELFDKTVELKKITDRTLEILNSDYFKQTVEILSQSPPSIIICFGIGRIGYCYVARYQFAYILSLKAHFQINSIQFHEPLLNQHEIDLINAVGCEVYTTNIEGKLKLDSSRTTLVYLPHCPKQLTNNLLWKNWSSASLQLLILICNSFQFTVTQTPNSDLHRDAGFISRIEKYTNEFCLKNSFESNNIFNDIAIHSFDTAKCEPNFFDSCVEPTYGLSELIKATESLSVE